MMICKECPYKKEYHGYRNRTAEVMCGHLDSKYIREYFEKHNIKKHEGFLGFINTKGVFPVKKAPKWCPLKREKGGEG